MSELTSLKLLDYADRELVGIVHDLIDSGDGYAGVDAIAKQLGLKHDRPHQCVGARLAWLRRYGVVDRKEGGRRWKVTEAGEAFLNGHINATLQKQLDKLEPGQLLMTTRFITGRQREADLPARSMLRREWTHGISR